MPTIVPAASRTMALLEVFARERRELSNSDLARLMDLPESSCSDLLHTLHELGYLMRTARTRRFYPTARLLTVAKGIAAGDSLYAVASEACELLRDKTGETGMCGRVEAGVVKVLAFAEGTHPLRYVENVGNKIALHVSALGKAELDLFLRRYEAPLDEVPDPYYDGEQGFEQVLDLIEDACDRLVIELKGRL